MGLFFESPGLLFVVLSMCTICFALSAKDAILVHSAVLDPAEKYRVSWNFDENEIVFEVQVETLGYVGFGLSPNGNMPGSDVVIGGVHNGTVYFTDRQATAKEEPTVDEFQDWHLVRGSQNNTHTTLRFWRPLDTCDDHDRPVRSETARVIWAYSNDDADSTGTVRYHSTNRGSKSIFLVNPQTVVPDIPQDSLIVDFLNNEVHVPAERTTYWCQAFDIPDVDRKHHVIKFEPVIQSGHVSLVHHILFIACYPPVTNATIGHGQPCAFGFMPEAWRGCTLTMFAWAVGAGPFYLPEHVGFPFGFDEDPSLILLQTHYDNPGLMTGLVDSSGLRLTLSPRPRKYDAATLATGLVVSTAQIIPPFAEKYRSDGHCVPQCLTQAMENKTSNINIFAGMLHSHLLGTGLRLRHFRKGVEEKIIVEDDNYDFNFQETRMLKQEVKVLPGDHLVTECEYRTTNKDKLTWGGESTNEEMCLTFVLYYPRIPLAWCSSYLDPAGLAKVVNATLDSNWTIETPEESRGKSFATFLSDDVVWQDKTTRDRLQEYSTAYDTPVGVLCIKEVSEGYPINREKVPLPEVKVKLPMDKGCVRLRDDATTTSPTDGATTTAHNLLVFFVYWTVSLLFEQMV